MMADRALGLGETGCGLGARHRHGEDLGAIGIDIGGSKIAVALVSVPAGRLECHETMPTPAAGGEAVLSVGAALVDNALSFARRRRIEVTGIGIGVPELVDRSGRITTSCVVPGLKTDDWTSWFGRFAPTTIESDVRAAAFAEATLGAGRYYRSLGYVSVGTGISYCLVCEGVAYVGSRGAAIQLGSAVTAEWQADGELHEWMLERLASGPALLARYKALGGTCSTTRAVIAAHGPEAAATQAVDEAARALGIGIALLVNLLDPDAIVVGGGLGSAAGPYWEGMVASAREHIRSEGAKGLPLVQAQLGPQSAVIGAALAGYHGLATSGQDRDGRETIPRPVMNRGGHGS
jgi:glucokinase